MHVREKSCIIKLVRLEMAAAVQPLREQSDVPAAPLWQRAGSLTGKGGSER